MAKFRKKPVVIEAIQYNGNNGTECRKFIKGQYDNTLNYPNVTTLHGTVRVNKWDWIIRGEFGDFWPCNPDIFEATYERVEDE